MAQYNVTMIPVWHVGIGAQEHGMGFAFDNYRNPTNSTPHIKDVNAIYGSEHRFTQQIGIADTWVYRIDTGTISPVGSGTQPAYTSILSTDIDAGLVASLHSQHPDWFAYTVLNRLRVYTPTSFPTDFNTMYIYTGDAWTASQNDGYNIAWYAMPIYSVVPEPSSFVLVFLILIAILPMLSVKLLLKLKGFKKWIYQAAGC